MQGEKQVAGSFDLEWHPIMKPLAEPVEPRWGPAYNIWGGPMCETPQIDGSTDGEVIHNPKMQIIGELTLMNPWPAGT